MEISNRLKELRTEQGYTQKYIAEKLGMKQPYYAKWENGIRVPKKDSLENLAKVFNVSVSYLLGETDTRSNELSESIEKLNEDNQKKVLLYVQELLSKQNNSIFLNNRRVHKIEVLNQHHLSAGLGASYTDEIETAEVLTDNDTPHDLAVWIEGNSMEPDFPNWDVALIKFQPTIDYEGQICAVDDVENGKAYIKSVSIEGKYLRLESLNKSINDEGNLRYPDIFLPLNTNPRIIGKIVDNFTPIEQ